jgi:putative ABC transport system permease protein
VVGFINNNRVHVDGLVEIGPSFGYDGIIVTSKETYESVLGNDHYYADPTKIELGLIRVADGFKVEEVAQSIILQLPPDVRLFTKQGLVRYEKDYWISSKPIGYIFGFGIAMGFVVGTIILYQILFTDIISNIEYYGVMLAIGYPMTYLRRIVASQAVIMSIVSFPLALSASSTGYIFLKAFTGLPFRMSIDKILGTYGLVLAMSILSAMLAISHLKSTNPADVFK